MGIPKQFRRKKKLRSGVNWNVKNFDRMIQYWVSGELGLSMLRDVASVRQRGGFGTPEDIHSAWFYICQVPGYHLVRDLLTKVYIDRVDPSSNESSIIRKFADCFHESNEKLPFVLPSSVVAELS